MDPSGFLFSDIREIPYIINLHLGRERRFIDPFLSAPTATYPAAAPTAMPQP